MVGDVVSSGALLYHSRDGRLVDVVLTCRRH